MSSGFSFARFFSFSRCCCQVTSSVRLSGPTESLMRWTVMRLILGCPFRITSSYCNFTHPVSRSTNPPTKEAFMKLLVFAGALRTDSCNKKFAREAARLVNEAGHEAEFLDLKDYP